MSVARCLVVFAGRCLGDERREWAQAMAAELDDAEADGRSLPFAIGCAIAAVRAMATQPEGRFTLAINAVAVGILVPAAALLLTGAVNGYPFLDEPLPAINSGNVAAAPPLMLSVIGLSVTQLLAAWAVIERDWSRLGTLGHAGAAIVATLIVFTGVVAPGEARLAPLVVGLAAEMAMIGALAGWDGRSTDAVFADAAPL